MIIKNDEVVAGDMTGADVRQIKTLYDEIGKLPYQQQASLVELAYNRLKSLKVGLEVTDYENDLYKETWMPAKRERSPMRASDIVPGETYRTHFHPGDGWRDLVTAVSVAKQGRILVRGENGRTCYLRAKDMKPWISVRQGGK